MNRNIYMMKAFLFYKHLSNMNQMRKTVILSSLLILSLLQVKAQEKSDFNISAPDIKVENSRYNNLYYIEARPNPDDMGVAYINGWHGVQPVTLSTPVDVQLQSVMAEITPSPEDTRTMAVQMRALFFDVGRGRPEGDGTCNLRITLYEKNDDKYYFLNTIDTLLAGDKKEIKQIAGSAIVSFIADNLSYYPYEDEQALDFQQVMDIDMYERNSIPFYTETQIPDGIYNKYKSLMRLTPDISSQEITAKMDKDELKEVKIPDINKPGKTIKIKAKDVYAVVIGGVPYISFEGNFRKAYQKENDWCFIITRKVANSGFSLGIGVGTSSRRMSGGVGIGLPIGGEKEKIEMFIDHLNGDFYWGGKVK